MIHWTEFKDAFAGDAVRLEGEWSELLRRIEQAHGYRDKKFCPWLKLARFGDKRSARDSLRNDANVLEITGIEGDYDGEVITPEEAIEKLEAANVRAAVYTSPRHTPEKPRWRVIAPCSKPLPPVERPRMLARINGALGGVLASESFTLSQGYFYGRTNDAPDYRVLVTFADPDEGYCVDQLDELDDIAIGKANGKANGTEHHAGEHGGEKPGEDVFAEKVKALGRKLKTGDGRREMLKTYIASRIGRGLKTDDVRLLIAGIAADYFDPRDPIDEKDVAEIVQWATSKEEEKKRTSEQAGGPWALPEAISAEEFKTAQGTPDCIVENYLWADVAELVAPGGTGKTTQYLYEAVHIALGRNLYGLRIFKPGPTLVLTNEDARPILVARLRLLCEALELQDHEIAKVREMVRISDVCGQGFKLTAVLNEVVVPTNRVAEIIAGCAELKPVLVIIDPMMSFGIGETRVNDAEQALVDVARQFRRALNCCARYVHHSGKFNARERTTDQYTGRGGSAMPDGCRMVHVMQSMAPDDWTNATGWNLEPGETAIRLARPKQSYSPPQPDILLHRRGFAFQHFYEDRREPSLSDNCAKVLAAITEAVAAGSYPTQNSLEAQNVLPSRSALRGAIATLLAENRIEVGERPDGTGRGPKTYLRPANRAGAVSPDQGAVQ